MFIILEQQAHTVLLGEGFDAGDDGSSAWMFEPQIGLDARTVGTSLHDAAQTFPVNGFNTSFDSGVSTVLHEKIRDETFLQTQTTMGIYGRFIETRASRRRRKKPGAIPVPGVFHNIGF